MIIIDKNVDSADRNRLEKHFETVLPSYPLSTLSAPLNTHPDLQLHLISETLAVCAPECYEYYKAHLPARISLKPGLSIPQVTYPNDIAYNVTRIGNTVFGKLANTDPVILREYQDQKCRLVNVNQGYTKCNTCILSDEAVITEDLGLHNIFMSTSIESMWIPSGFVRLAGFSYGFIGGASGLVNDTLIFGGTITKHPKAGEILGFLEKHNTAYFELNDRNLTDLGSIFHIKV